MKVSNMLCNGMVRFPAVQQCAMGSESERRHIDPIWLDLCQSGLKSDESPMEGRRSTNAQIVTATRAKGRKTNREPK
jgi:hypothetical protein